MDAALRHLAEQQRRSLTSHPTPQELAAYHAGELPPEAESRLLDHLAICRDCSDLLLDLAGFADLKPPQGVPELTDEQVEQDWQALRSRMRAGEGVKERTAEVVPIRPAGPVPRLERSYWLPIAASLLAVLGFSFGLYQSVKVGRYSEPQLVREVDPGSVVRGDVPGQSFSSRAPGLIRLSPDPNVEASYPYEAEIVHEEQGEVVKRIPVKTIDEDPLLLIPAGSLAPGSYRAYLYGIQEGEKKELSEVAFDVNDP
ncbi:MAG TPA: zf-HC2 domain-containing protein [Thermoanaerobaculia bacterium]|nr:zf-HC2 domain-containing protein [Thermoanaerobaculia bacterium]